MIVACIYAASERLVTALAVGLNFLGWVTTFVALLATLALVSTWIL